MLHWDFVWKEHERELENFSFQQRRILALACLNDVWTEYSAYFDKALDSDQHELVTCCLEDLKVGAEVPYDRVESLDQLVDQPLPSGVWDLFMGVVHLSNCWDKFTTGDALEVISFAYQVVLNFEIMSKLQTEKREDEIRMLEAENHACLRTLNKQLELLNESRNG